MNDFAKLPFRSVAACAFALAGSAVLLTGTPSQGQSSVNPANRVDVSHSPSPKVIVPTRPDQKQSSGWLSDKVVRRLGQPVDQLTFRVTNKTESAVSYDFSTGHQFDLIVSDASGNPVWDWSKGRMFPQLVTHLTLKPGQSHDYVVTWNRRDNNARPVPPGTYTAAATLRTMPKVVVAGTATVNPNREQGDPTNVGVRVPANAQRATDAAQNGTLQQSDITPPVSAQTTIVVTGNS